MEMECRIRVRGHPDPIWERHLAGLRIIHEGDGVSLLVGPLPDQAALHGVLLLLFRLGLPLLSLETREGREREGTVGGDGVGGIGGP